MERKTCWLWQLYLACKQRFLCNEWPYCLSPPSFRPSWQPSNTCRCFFIILEKSQAFKKFKSFLLDYGDHGTIIIWLLASDLEEDKAILASLALEPHTQLTESEKTNAFLSLLLWFNFNRFSNLRNLGFRTTLVEKSLKTGFNIFGVKFQMSHWFDFPTWWFCLTISSLTVLGQKRTYTCHIRTMCTCRVHPVLTAECIKSYKRRSRQTCCSILRSG